MKAWVAKLHQQPHSRCKLLDFPCHGLYANPVHVSLNCSYDIGLGQTVCSAVGPREICMHVPGIASLHRVELRTMILHQAICDVFRR